MKEEAEKAQRELEGTLDDWYARLLKEVEPEKFSEECTKLNDKAIKLSHLVKILNKLMQKPPLRNE